jgi:hypothetical protein
MTRSLALALLVGMALPLSAFAQPRLFDDETIETKIEFLRSLRRKGYAALAKEYGDKLIKAAANNDLPILKLEQARTAVALAKEKGPGQRLKMLDEARAAFEPFLQADPNSATGAQARIEMAGVYSMQADMRLNKALAADDADADVREKGAREARDLYDAADSEFTAAIKVLRNLNQKTDADRAEFDRALNLIDKAFAFIKSDQNRQRAETVDSARAVFAEFAKDKESATGLMANAYLVKCYQALESPDKVNEHIAILDAASGPAAIPAQRLGFYYDILYDLKRPNFEQVRSAFKGDRLKAVIERTNDWLQRYPAAKKSREGEELRFMQAQAHFSYARSQAPEKIKANLKFVEGHLNSADKIAKELQGENGDFSERSSYLHNEIERFRIRAGLTKSLATFDTALFVAKDKFIEAANAQEAEAPKLFRDGQALLRNAILVGEKEGVQASKMHEAQLLLASAFNGVKDYRRAAICYEALARATPPSKIGAEAASRAMELYKRFADDDNDETARLYLRDLGEYILSPAMKRVWEGDIVFGVARYNLAMDFLAQEKYQEALEQLEAMPKDFPAYIYSQGQAVFIALAARNAADGADDKKAYTQRAKVALGRLGSLPPNADPSTTLMWFNASLEGPKFLYADAAVILYSEASDAEKIKGAAASYGDMAKSVAAIETVFAKEGSKLADDKKKSVGFTIEVLKKYTHLGAAEIEYRKGNYNKVLDDNMLGGLIREIHAKGKQNPKDPIPVLEVRVVGESLSLALRALIQVNELEQAKGAYGLLMRIKSAGTDHDNTNFTRDLTKALADQVDEMKKKNENAKLKVMVANFTNFGDVLTKSLVYDTKKPELSDIKNLIRFYTSLEQFKKAYDLIKYVPEPKFLNQKLAKATDEQNRELHHYWDFQLEYGNMLRQSKDYEGANKVYVRLLNHPNGRLIWSAKKEQIHIYEEKESYGTAIKLWKGFMDDLQRAGIGQDKDMQNKYFEAYYYSALCYYKHSQLQKTIKDGKSDTYLTYAAQQIYRLETSRDPLGWQIAGPRFVALMEREKKLKAAYEVAKKMAK